LRRAARAALGARPGEPVDLAPELRGEDSLADEDGREGAPGVVPPLGDEREERFACRETALYDLEPDLTIDDVLIDHPTAVLTAGSSSDPRTRG
jgi:hypothetical protein